MPAARIAPFPRQVGLILHLRGTGTTRNLSCQRGLRSLVRTVWQVSVTCAAKHVLRESIGNDVQGPLSGLDRRADCGPVTQIDKGTRRRSLVLLQLVWRATVTASRDVNSPRRLRP